MKTIVSVQEISELDIKPPEAVQTWRALIKDDIGRRWSDRSSWRTVDCPSCGSTDHSFQFERWTVKYHECNSCGTLFATERPSAEDTFAWYRDSDSSKYWRIEMLPASSSQRMDRIIRPRADWIESGISEYSPGATSFVDLSSHGSQLVDELRSRFADASIDHVKIGVDDVASFSRVLQPGSKEVVVAIDLFDRVTDLIDTVQRIHSSLRTDGVVFATMPVASGFEIQSLWEESPTIIPPDKINLPTVLGIENLFSAPKWEILELSTPGEFDVELVRSVVSEHPEKPWPRVLRQLVLQDDIHARYRLVEYLQSVRMASFARLVARKVA